MKNRLLILKFLHVLIIHIIHILHLFIYILLFLDVQTSREYLEGPTKPKFTLFVLIFRKIAIFTIYRPDPGPDRN